MHRLFVSSFVIRPSSLFRGFEFRHSNFLPQHPMIIPFQANNITVGTSLTQLLQFPLAGLDRLISFQLINAAGSSTLNNFLIVRQLHDAGNWLNYLGGTDFQTATSKCIASTPGPHQLPAGQSAWVDVDCGAAVMIQLWASVASGSAVVSVFGGGRR
jgi:hypothetical protein